MRDYANNANTPDFVPATIVRGARRRILSLVMASIAAVVILGSAGTALAVTAASGPSTTSNPATGCRPTSTSSPYNGSPYATSNPETGCHPTSTSTSTPATGS